MVFMQVEQPPDSPKFTLLSPLPKADSGEDLSAFSLYVLWKSYGKRMDLAICPEGGVVRSAIPEEGNCIVKGLQPKWLCFQLPLVLKPHNPSLSLGYKFNAAPLKRSTDSHPRNPIYDYCSSTA